uniref:sphingolipid C(9)-methyltransferase n=1 Tax=Hirondellea gigas TaxID=1518452 RepID=A0A2P2HXW5_9CRUS
MPIKIEGVTHDSPDWRHINWTSLITIVIAIPISIVYVLNRFFLGLSLTHVSLWLLVLIVFIVTILPVFALFVVFRSWFMVKLPPAKDIEKYFSFNDKTVRSWFGSSLSKTVPISHFHDAYMDGKIDIKQDLLHILNNRSSFADFRLTFAQLKFFFVHLIPEMLNHSRSMDRAQVTNHYNRGNDFYNAFLGETMIYTSAFFKNPNDSLEVAQTQKLDLVCRKLHLKKGSRHLDLGCGWGTLVCHAAKQYGANSIGITLANEQVKHAEVLFRDSNVANQSSKDGWAKAVCCDYRDTPREHRYDAISCLEMAEHVGVRNFSSFLRQVYDMLEDDGLFYIQIAGLRRSWQFEDLNWGLFMGKYVFPGADASMPVGWVINQLEENGFEIHSLENVGIHYSATINHWYDNWQSNREYIIKKYGPRWFRQWNWFLAWSVIAPGQGSATCHQIMCYKNTSSFNRKIFIGEQRSFDY